jgi:hypothetical protein
MPKSPLSQTHQLLVGQKLNGWPQVQVLDDTGVDVRDVSVRFTATGSASFPTAPNGVFEVDTNNGGRAIALGLHGDEPGSATVTVSLPDSPETDPLEYQVNVVQAG